MGPRWKKEEEEDDRGCFLCFLLSSLLAAPHSPPLAAAADGPKGGGRRRGALETWYPLPLYYHPSPFPLDLLLLLLLLFAAAFCLPSPPFQLVRPSSEKEEGKGDGRRTGKKEPSWIAFFFADEDEEVEEEEAAAASIAAAAADSVVAVDKVEKVNSLGAPSFLGKKIRASFFGEDRTWLFVLLLNQWRKITKSEDAVIVLMGVE